MQVLINDISLVQRRAIKKVIQPGTGSKNNNFANINCCYHTNARNCGALRYELRHTKTTYENDVRRTKNSYYVRGRKFLPRRPLTFCVAFLHVKKCYTSASLGPEFVCLSNWYYVLFMG